MNKLVALISITLFGLVACAPSASQVKKIIEDDPTIVFAAIKKDPKAFMDAVNEAAQQAQRQQRDDQAANEEKALEEEFKSPKTPAIDESRVFFGPKTAAVTIVEYSDFQCPFCSKAYETMKTLVNDKYKGKVRVLYKHLPFKSNAEPAARYYEAIAMQSHAKAKKFHDYLYENQAGIRKGEPFFKEAARKAGADLARIAKDMKSDRVNKILEEDFAEARGFDMNGTPGFLVKGVSVKGAYPIEHFSMIIDRHLAKK